MRRHAVGLPLRAEEQERVPHAGVDVGDDGIAAGVASTGIVEALEVAAERERHHRLPIGHEVLDVRGYIASASVEDAGAALVAVLLLELAQLLLEDVHELGPGGQDALQLAHERLDRAQLVEDLLALQRRQAAQGHVEDGPCLARGEVQGGDQAVGGGLTGARLANNLDDTVEVVQRHFEPLQHVAAVVGLVEVVFGAAADDVLAVLDEDGERLLEREGLRCAVDQAQHVDAERHLQVGLVEQGVEDRVELGVALDLDHNAHAVAVALVAQGGDAVDLALAHEVGDRLDELRLVDLVRQLGHDERLAALLIALDRGGGAQRDLAGAGRVGVFDALATDDQSAAGEVGAGHDGHELFHRSVRVLD